MESEITLEELASRPLREMQFTQVPEVGEGLLPRVLLLPHGATAVGFAPGGALESILVYRTTGMPGVTRWLVRGGEVVRDLEVTRPRPGAPIEVLDAAGGDLRGRLESLSRQLVAVSEFMQQVAWRTPPGLGQTSMHHNHRLGLMADRVMSSDIGKTDIQWLGLIGPLANEGEVRLVEAPAMRDLGRRSLARLAASLRGDIQTREP
jgi:hypothetical protein